MLVKWYHMADKAMKEKIGERGKTIYFKNLTRNPKSSILELYNFLGIDPGKGVYVELDGEEERAMHYKSPHSYDDQIGIDRDWIEEELGHLFTNEIRQLI